MSPDVTNEPGEQAAADGQDEDHGAGPRPFAVVDPDEALAVLGELRTRRRQRRTAQIAWFDAFYQAYVTALFAGVAILLGSGFVGGGPVDEAGVDRILADGPRVLGLLAAFALAAGLRSGSRGGPLAVEPADVQHALLAPLSLRKALHGPAVRQARFLLFVAVVAGAIDGKIVDRRLDCGIALWAATAALWAAAVVVGVLGCGWVASGHRLHRSVATAIGLALVAWSVGDLTEVLPQSPLTELGRIALWPLEAEPLALAPAVALLALAAWGLVSLGGCSLEQAQRRSALVGELRFAATMRDLRSVIVLRRQLMQEQARTRPWLPSRARGGRTLVVLRGWRGLDRIPATRILRMAGFGVAAGLAARAAWNGATPLVVVAGICAFVAALDAIEPLSQEVDHPTFTELAPVDLGEVLVRHLVVSTLTTAAVAAAGLGAVALTEVQGDGWAVAGVTAVAVTLSATAGAAISTVKDLKASGDITSGQTESLMPPEAAGVRLIFQTIWPPAVAMAGFLPLVMARHAEDAGRPVANTAVTWLLAVVMLTALVAGWVRFRQEIHTWFAQAQQQSMGGSTT